MVDRPSWEKWKNHPGPDPEVEHEALVRWNAEKGRMHNSGRQSGDSHHLHSPRQMKHRGHRFNGVRID